MKQPLFPGNIEIDEKRIAFIEKVVTRLARRARKKSVAMITPYPVSNAVFGEDIKGPVLRYMFPGQGTVTKGLIDAGKKTKSGVIIDLTIKNQAHGSALSYTMSGRTFLARPNVKVDSGDQLTVSIHPIDEEEKLEEVWVSFLWVPEVNETHIKEYLIDELEHDLLEEEN